MKNATVNVQVGVFVWTSVPSLLNMYLGVASLGPMVTLSVFNILRNCQTFLKWLSHFTVPIFFFLNNDGHRESGSVVFNADSRAKGLGSDPSWETEQFPSPL